MSFSTVRRSARRPTPDPVRDRSRRPGAAARTGLLPLWTANGPPWQYAPLVHFTTQRPKLTRPYLVRAHLMDLEAYALTHEESEQAATPLHGAVDNASDAVGAHDKGKGRAIDPVVSKGTEEPGEITFEQDVRQLAQNVSSWWSGFSKKSQEQISLAQKQIASQGGIINYAKNEATRFETQIDETRKKAKAQREAEDAAMQKARQEEAEVSDTTHSPVAAADTSALQPDDATRSVTEAAAADSVGPSSPEAESAPSIISRLQTLSSDPRIASLQSDVSKRISSLFAPQNTTERSGAVDEEKTQPLTKSVQSALQDVSQSLRQLGGAEGRAYAQRYLKASEDLVGRVGEEWKDMMGELVRVVPADADVEQKGAQRDASTVSTAATQVKPEATSTASSKMIDERRDATDRPSTETVLTSSQPSTSTPMSATARTASNASAAGSTDDEDAFSWEEAGNSAESSSNQVAASLAKGPRTSSTDQSAHSQEKSAPAAAAPAASGSDSDSDSDWE
ncbi:unnamed protein product [Parajaminaea phylloscopi]